MSKYRNVKVLADGIKFDSKAEAVRYKELRLLEKAGKLRELELQPEFVLQKSFKYGDKTIRKIKYIADFAYIDTETGRYTVEDVKGVETKDFKLKLKLFLYKYGGGLDFKIIR